MVCVIEGLLGSHYMRCFVDNVPLRPDYQGWVESFELIVMVTGSCRYTKNDL